RLVIHMRVRKGGHGVQAIAHDELQVLHWQLATLEHGAYTNGRFVAQATDLVVDLLAVTPLRRLIAFLGLRSRNQGQRPQRGQAAGDAGRNPGWIHGLLLDASRGHGAVRPGAGQDKAAQAIRNTGLMVTPILESSNAWLMSANG